MTDTRLICTCDGTMTLASETLGAEGKPAFQLCRAQLDHFRAALGEFADITVACTQEAPLFAEVAEDAGFAELVRKAIFTYVHVPARIHARDVPKIIRILDQAVLITAMAGAMGKPELEAANEFILANISQRMAEGLREEITARGKVKDKDAEEAMGQIISAIRTLESSGELVLVQEEEAD